MWDTFRFPCNYSWVHILPHGDTDIEKKIHKKISKKYIKVELWTEQKKKKKKNVH